MYLIIYIEFMIIGEMVNVGILGATGMVGQR